MFKVVTLRIEKMTLAQLGQEYEKHIELQQYFIDKCKAEIKKAKEMGDSNAVSELKTKLNKFYEIKIELTETAKKLKNYYKGDDTSDSV